MQNKLDDIFDQKTRLLFCGMAVGKKSCKMNHYYADTGRNRFWEILKEVGLIGELIIPTSESKKREENYDKLRGLGIGFTDLVKDQCGMDGNIKVKNNDVSILQNKIKGKGDFIVAFTGKKPAANFLNIRETKLKFGYQSEVSKDGIDIWILPSTSRVNASFNRYKEEWLNLSKRYDKIKRTV